MREPISGPQLGEEVLGRIKASAGPNVWLVDISARGGCWSAKLTSKSAKLYGPGDEQLFWVYGTVPNISEVLLADDDFGRLPISDRMRPRYLGAIRSALRILALPDDITHEAGEHLSELKGMFNRCIRKDQWDWLTVYNTLGRPPIEKMREAAFAAGELARSIRRGEATEIHEQVARFVALDIGAALRKAEESILKAAPRLGTGVVFERVSDSSIEGTSAIDQGMTDPYIISRVARAKHERANAVHQKALAILVAFLESKGFLVERSRLVDAYTRLRGGPAMFEVKSITEQNERAQCRQALSQLYEYRFLHSVPEASLWLVLSDRPRMNWLIDYLQSDRGLEVLWVQDDRLAGPGLPRLLESGSEARRRLNTSPR